MDTVRCAKAKAELRKKKPKRAELVALFSPDKAESL
jgi:hypothetical protein